MRVHSPSKTGVNALWTRYGEIRELLADRKIDPDVAISAFTRVHSPSKTGVNALMDALWLHPGYEPSISR